MSTAHRLNLDINTSNEWHILKGEDQFGPYTYVEVIKLLQNKTVFDFDFAWSPHLDGWTSIADLPEFSADRLNRVLEKNPEAEGDVFNRRSSERVAVSIPVYCHDNSRLWAGTCENLSEGGALILMNNPILLPGHIVHVHFKALNENEKAFNCTAEILTKRMTKVRIQHDTGIHYAVRFLQALPTGKTQIRTWVQAELKKFKKDKK